MRARIIAPFAVSVIAFVFSYVFYREDESLVTLLFIAVGIVLAGAGVVIAARDRD